MHPVLNFGSHQISTYYVMCAVAALSVPLVILARRRHYGMNTPQALFLSVAAILSGFLGCNTLYWLENLGELVEEGWRFSGFSFFGCVMIAPPVLILFALILKIPAGRAMDLLAAGLPPFLAIVRIGCFCGGCCGGVTFFTESGKGFTVPTQLIECLFDFLLFALILSLEKRRRLENYHFPVFLVGYGVIRFVIEFFRVTEKRFFGFSNGQIYSVLILLVGGIILLCARERIRAAHRAIAEEAELLRKQKRAARRKRRR